MITHVIRKECEQCGKVAVEKSRLTMGETTLISLECGHVLFEKPLASSADDLQFGNVKLMPYQVEGVRFAEKANCRCLIADEQGLGKTIQANALLALHKDELFPAVIVTKTTLKQQWLYEIIRMLGSPLSGGPLPLIIGSGKEKALPGFEIYIVTYDLLKTPQMFEDVNIKTVIIDECQAIKSHTTGRAVAMQSICTTVEHIIGLSGTPIKNNAGEYFTILNLLQPRRFPTWRAYVDRYCDSYNNGYSEKVGGLREPELFKANTEDFIIRRTKFEVLPDLPEKSRNLHYVEITNAGLNDSYNRHLEELEEVLYSNENESDKMRMTIDVITKLRQVTGIGKCDACAEFVADHIISTGRKIVVFLHHHDVHTLLEMKINSWLADGGFEPCLNLTSNLTADRRSEVIREFREEEKYMVLIASTLAAGEGLNLQFCSDAVMLERQWNPANEEQAEDRFHRFGQANPVTITYMIASEMVDQYFTELVEQKRAYVASTLDYKEITWDQSSLMQDLAASLIAHGKRKVAKR